MPLWVYNARMTSTTSRIGAVASMVVAVVGKSCLVLWRRMIRSRSAAFPPKSSWGPLRKPKHQGVWINIKDKNTVEEMHHVCMVPEAAAKESHAEVMVLDMGKHFVRIPNALAVRPLRARRRDF